MRVLVVGANSKYAIELPYIKYLREQEGIARVDFFEAQNFFLNYYQKSTFNKVAFRLGFSSILKLINEGLIESIEQLNPDVLFVFKGMEIFPQTLLFAKARGIKAVNYNPDNPFVFSGKGSGNQNVRASVGCYDLHFTYDRSIQNRIERQFKIRCELLPFGFDLSQDIYDKCQIEKDIDRVCFIGNPDRDRATFLIDLAKCDISIDVYGNRWSSFLNLKNPKIKAYPAVFGDTFWEMLRKYRVQLNLMRVHNPNSHNMRTFEIPAIGGIQLAPNTLDHRLFFEQYKEIFLFDGISTCKQQIRDLLSMNSAEAHAVRSSARKRSIDSGYCYRNRAAQIYQELKTL